MDFKIVLLFTLFAFVFATNTRGDCIAGGMTTSGTPTSISSLPCHSIAISYPYQLTWNGETRGIPDSKGDATGFTMVMPSNAGNEYLASSVNVLEPGVLSLTTTTGLFNLKNLVNALGVGLMMYSPISFSTSIDLPVSPWTGQAGLWFGMKESDNIKFVSLAPTSEGELQVESKLEINGAKITEVRVFLPGPIRKINLWIEPDPTSMSVSTYYSTDVSPNKILAWRHDKIPPEWFGLGKSVILDQIGTNIFGGIYASRVNAATSSKYNFTSFAVNQVPLYPNKEDGCYPSYSPYLPYGLSLSTLDCSEVGSGVDTSRALTFQGDNGGIKDKNGVGTGLTMSLPSEDGNSILAYDISTGDGMLRYVPTTTIPQGTVYELNNALGLGISAQVPQKVSITIVKMTAGTGNYEQAGLAIGVSQRSCIKFLLMSEKKSSPFILRLNYRIDGVVLSTFDITNFMSGATDTDPGSDVTLSFTTDPTASTISASYNGTLFKTISVPQEWFSVPTSGEIGTHLFSHLAGSIKYRKSFYEIRYSNFVVENI